MGNAEEPQPSESRQEWAAESPGPGREAPVPPSVGGMGRRPARSLSAREGWHHTPGTGAVVRDRRRFADVRFAVGWAAAFAACAFLLDWSSGGLTPARAGIWSVFAAVAFALLLPPRVTAGEDWLAVRGLIRKRRVRTDALVAVGISGAVAVRLILRDAYGGRVELDPRTLVASPLLWHALDTGARRSRERGILRHGCEALGEVAELVDGEAALAVFRASGLR